METTTTNPIDAPPDWMAPDAAELTCPLCEYNLRGLTDPRCPECGFAFTWAELRAADRGRHPYLFEHADRRRVRAFVLTWWWDGRPWRFWRDVTPANPVRLGRLVLYWFLSSLITTAVLLAPLPHGLVQAAADYQRGVFIARSYPRGPVEPPMWDWLVRLSTATWAAVQSWPPNVAILGPVLILLAWPWLSVLALMVFQGSMLKARIAPAHVVRAAVYGCDFGAVVVAVVIAAVPVIHRWTSWWSQDDGVPLLWLAGVCGVVATVRLTFAYTRYLRFHLPLATVVASQVVVVLAVVFVVTQTTNLNNLFW